MQKEIIIAGFGGQGALFAGQVLAFAAMDSGKDVPGCPRMDRKCAVAPPIARW
jgi:2-oxoglutarate ferredoxin oxidoreductase subunit gamma